MNDMALHSIELCAGVGMLGEGVRAAFEYLGHRHRTVCYVEREASAAGQIVALMEAGALDEAPIWSDLLTFDGAAWRGRVHCVIAGFPCQDLSVAGRRAGLNGKRSGLFFNVLDIADACGAQLLVLENVSGITSATASVVDETEGELFERASSRVLGELADRGWDAECLLIRASDVGANHQRERWFCVAWRMADAERPEWWPFGTGGSRSEPWQHGERQADSRTGVGSSPLGHAGLQHSDVQQREIRPEYSTAGNELGDPSRERDGAHEQERFERRCCTTDACACSPELGNAARDGRNEGGTESDRLEGRSDSGGTSSTVGHADGTRLQGWRNDAGERGGQRSPWPSGADDIFAPGPLDDRWPGIVADRPDLAPATEPGVRMLADGMAYLVDESRNHQLRQVGNGVVALQAAVAIITLARRANIF